MNKNIITYGIIALLFIGVAIAGGAVEIGGGIEKPIRTIPISTDTATKYHEVHGVELSDADIQAIAEDKINNDYMTLLWKNISMHMKPYMEHPNPTMLKRLDTCITLFNETNDKNTKK